MEELLGLQDEIAPSPPCPKHNRDFGESWEDISQRMKRTLQLQASTAAEQTEGRLGRKKFFSETSSPYGKPSLHKKVTIREGYAQPPADNSRARLKIMRTITEDDNVESYRKSLTKRTNTGQDKQERVKLRELKFNSPSPSPLAFNMKPLTIKSLQNSLKKPEPSKKATMNRQNNGEQGNESPQRAFQKQNRLPVGNRMFKSRSQALCSPKGTMVPAKVVILMGSEGQSELKMIENVSHTLLLRKSIHLQEYSHLRDNRNDRLPFLSLDHQRKQRDSIHARNAHKQWLFVQRALAKTHPNDECKRARERELQARLRRDLEELNKKGKLFANIRPTKLKLFK